MLEFILVMQATKLEILTRVSGTFLIRREYFSLIGQSKNEISLRFLEPPQIFGLLNYTLIEEDQTFRTACKVKGFPQDNF